MLDHFGYDSTTVRIKRFVNYMLKRADQLTNNKNLAIDEAMKGTSDELVHYFSELFPPMINEIITCLIAAATKEASNLALTNMDSNETALGAQTHSTNHHGVNAPVNNKPDMFFKDVKCFKCGRFSTKFKHSLFAHLHVEHGYGLKDMERLYEQCIQRQLCIIDEQGLVGAFEKQSADIFLHQQAILKETREKNELSQQHQQKMIMLTENQPNSAANSAQVCLKRN